MMIQIKRMYDPLEKKMARDSLWNACGHEG